MASVVFSRYSDNLNQNNEQRRQWLRPGKKNILMEKSINGVNMLVVCMGHQGNRLNVGTTSNEKDNNHYNNCNDLKRNEAKRKKGNYYRNNNGNN